MLREIIYFVLDGRVFYSPVVQLKRFSKVVLFVFETYIVVWIIVTSLIMRIRGAKIVMNISVIIRPLVDLKIAASLKSLCCVPRVASSV